MIAHTTTEGLPKLVWRRRILIASAPARCMPYLLLERDNACVLLAIHHSQSLAIASPRLCVTFVLYFRIQSLPLALNYTAWPPQTSNMTAL
eukprot:scaffold48713_cov28-Tisochrysis_lutea.AAC.4